ncbi:hypothetical protein WA026_013364 [Henosepilachna vigintioctopunctata]|uniref:Uncharacterized protein n=1 Tax=Henosepilachna vigintioctopunctata TaxID=420089 RepID=A0AAW1V6W6_9CUCU
MFKTKLEERLNANAFPTLFAPPEVSTVKSGRDSSYSKSETLPVKICSPNLVRTPSVYAVGDLNAQKEVVHSTNKILARLDDSVEDTTCMENRKVHMTCNGDQNRHASQIQSVSKCNVEDLASSLVKKEYDLDKSIDSNDFVDELSDYNVHIGSRELNYLGKECIQPEMVKSEQLDSTHNPMSKIVKTENIFKEASDNIMIKKEIEYMEVTENRNMVVHRLFNERMMWNDHKGIRDFNIGNACIKEEMIEYKQIDSTENQMPKMVENEIDVEEVCDDIIIKKEIEFVDVHEDKHIVDQCLYNEKKIYNPNEPVIETK